MDDSTYKTPRLVSFELSKYLSHEVVFSFLSGTIIFLLIMLMFQMIRLSEFVVVHQVALKDVARLFSYMALAFFPIAIPISFLFSVLMGISRANSEGEILALQVNGFSLKQIFLPVLVFSGVVSLFCLYTSLYTVPQGNRSFELLVTKLTNERAIAALKPGVFSDLHGLTLYAEEVIPVKNEMKRVFIYDEREEAHPLAISAEAGLLKRQETKGVLTLRLTNGTISIDSKPLDGIQQKMGFEVYDINLNLDPKGDSWRAYSPPSYTYPQLKQRLTEVLPDPPQYRQLLVELHKRFSLSFSCLVFAGLGFFIGTLSQRGIRSTAILLCLAVGLVYWLSYLAANALAAGGWIMPWLGMWLPNIAFAGVGYLCYRRTLRGI